MSNASANPDHDYSVRVITEDGILVSEDTDFSENGRWDYFLETVRQAEAGEIVQLLFEDTIAAEQNSSGRRRKLKLNNQMNEQSDIPEEPQSGFVLDLTTLLVSAVLLAIVGAAYLLFNWLLGVLGG